MIDIPNLADTAGPALMKDMTGAAVMTDIDDILIIVPALPADSICGNPGAAGLRCKEGLRPDSAPADRCFDDYVIAP